MDFTYNEITDGSKCIYFVKLDPTDTEMYVSDNKGGRIKVSLERARRIYKSYLRNGFTKQDPNYYRKRSTDRAFAQTEFSKITGGVGVGSFIPLR